MMRRTLFVALLATLPMLCCADTIDDIRERGSLRVATTLDYRPFSYLDAGEKRGIDVELAQLLAEHLEVELVWVATRWSDLIDDLTANRFDIAMSGISITAEREALGDFSAPYFHTGKTVLARCAIAETLHALTDVDRPEVTVIVNPGGSNQRFVNENIRHARVIVHPDNIGIFAALASGTADVMITDAVEAELESAGDDALCMTPMRAYLEPIVKAWLMPQDPLWKARIDAFLADLSANGTLDRIRTRYLPTVQPTTP